MGWISHVKLMMPAMTQKASVLFPIGVLSCRQLKRKICKIAIRISATPQANPMILEAQES
jgi:hypothetical protein